MCYTTDNKSYSDSLNIILIQDLKTTLQEKKMCLDKANKMQFETEVKKATFIMHIFLDLHVYHFSTLWPLMVLI